MRNKFNYNQFNVNNFHNKKAIINTDNEHTLFYLAESAKNNVLDNKTEQYYICQIKSGSNNSEFYKNELVKSHQAFVIALAQKKCHGNDDIFMDLVQEGNYGMMMALENYNPDSNAKFISYANAWILKYMYKFLEVNELVQKQNRTKTFSIDRKVREEFVRENGYEPTSEELIEIFQEMGISLKHKEDLDEISVISVDGPMYQNANDDSDDELLFDIPDTDEHLENDIDKDFMQSAVHSMLGSLPEIERSVIEKRFGFNGSVEKDNRTIAEEMGLTVADVKIYGERAMRKLSKCKRLFA